VIEELQRVGVVPDNVLPRWVYRLPDGLFGAKVKKDGTVLSLGPFETPESAHRAMAEAYPVQFPHHLARTTTRRPAAVALSLLVPSGTGQATAAPILQQAGKPCEGAER
jgi:hypothetical protein